MSQPGKLRILVTRLSHIGDCILTLPMVRAIKREYPDSYVAWAVERPANQLLELHPDIDQIIQVPKGWLSRPSNWFSLSRQLRRFQFDVAIDPQGITKSALLGWLSGAGQRIGIRGKWGRELSPLLNNELVVTRKTHLVDRSLELLQSLGVTDLTVDFGLPVCPQARESMERFRRDADLPDRFVILNPGASWPSKRWENPRFAEVAKDLWDQHQVRSLITWAGDQEQQMAVEINQLAPDSTLLAPQTSLREFAALARRAEFFIGCDTGPLHIAVAMGCPCVGLYGTTLPQESGAYGSQHLAIQKWHQAGSCTERRSAPNRAMQDIQVADVTAAISAWLADSNRFRFPEFPRQDSGDPRDSAENAA